MSNPLSFPPAAIAFFAPAPAAASSAALGTAGGAARETDAADHRQAVTTIPNRPFRRVCMPTIIRLTHRSMQSSRPTLQKVDREMKEGCGPALSFDAIAWRRSTQPPGLTPISEESCIASAGKCAGYLPWTKPRPWFSALMKYPTNSNSTAIYR
jgi:hypothetical protein